MMRAAELVGVRELRTHLSAYLRAVARGRTVTIADRGRKPVARLVPIEGSKDWDAIERLAARGTVRRSRGVLRLRPRVRLRGRGPLASDMVLEDRR